MATKNATLIACTALRRYAFDQSDVMAIRLASPGAGLSGLDERGQPFMNVQLGALLDPTDRDRAHRQRALIVSMRRRSIALLVDQVEQTPEGAQTVPLPPLLRARLREPWATGALVYDDLLVIKLDLRAVVRSVLAAPPRVAS